MTRRWLLWLPLLLGTGLFVLFFFGLENPGDRIIESNVVGEDLPDFRTAPAVAGFDPVDSAGLTDGKPRLVNVFASWCVPCIREVPVLLRLQSQGIEIDGIAVHDDPGELIRFLSDNGNPYRRIGLDNEGRAQLSIGSSGVPETFVVDAAGRITYQHIGIVTEADIPEIMQKLGRR